MYIYKFLINVDVIDYFSFPQTPQNSTRYKSENLQIPSSRSVRTNVQKMKSSSPFFTTQVHDEFAFRMQELHKKVPVWCLKVPVWVYDISTEMKATWREICIIIRCKENSEVSFYIWDNNTQTTEDFVFELCNGIFIDFWSRWRSRLGKKPSPLEFAIRHKDSL